MLVVEALNELGRHIEKSQQAFDHTVRRLTTGRGNLSNRVVQLEKLGARTKRKLPKNMIENHDEAEHDVEADRGSNIEDQSE